MRGLARMRGAVINEDMAEAFEFPTSGFGELNENRKYCWHAPPICQIGAYVIHYLAMTYLLLTQMPNTTMKPCQTFFIKTLGPNGEPKSSNSSFDPIGRYDDKNWTMVGD